jgi:hypothetical protein
VMILALYNTRRGWAGGNGPLLSSHGPNYISPFLYLLAFHWGGAFLSASNQPSSAVRTPKKHGPSPRGLRAHAVHTRPSQLVRPAHLVFNQPKFLPIATVGLRPSQVVRSTALGVLFPELQEHIAPPVPVCACRRVFSFSSKAATYSPPRPPAGSATSRYFPGILFREGLLLS